jgi:hypothetical protein
MVMQPSWLQSFSSDSCEPEFTFKVQVLGTIFLHYLFTDIGNILYISSSLALGIR